ncbi:348_t:CDS:2, partial [Diversispora eburnea]
FLNNHKPPPGHNKPPLLPIISLDYYIPDELHIMLRIWDRLWNQGTQNWEFTSLMEGDKEIFLKNFNFEVIFDKERAILINNLWREFYQLYKPIKFKETNSTQFYNQAKQWLDLFLTPSQGEPNTITFKMGLY